MGTAHGERHANLHAHRGTTGLHRRKRTAAAARQPPELPEVGTHHRSHDVRRGRNTDENGEYKSVSFIVNFRKENISVFFGGDTVPYPGQDAAILRNLPSGAKLIMCLPANGRDEARHAMGIAGNMDIDEAVCLAQSCGAELLIPCHIKMFAGNDPAEPVTIEYCEKLGMKTLLPEAGKEFYL